MTPLRTFCSAQTSKRAQLTEAGESADGRRRPREGKTRPPVFCGFAVKEYQTVALSWRRILLLRHECRNTHTHQHALVHAHGFSRGQPLRTCAGISRVEGYRVSHTSRHPSVLQRDAQHSYSAHVLLVLLSTVCAFTHRTHARAQERTCTGGIARTDGIP